MTTPRGPQKGKDYRILAVKDQPQTHLVGRVITVQSIGGQDADMYWMVQGRVHGIPGSVEVIAALQHDSGPCNCTAYDYPHSKTRGCK